MEVRLLELPLRAFGAEATAARVELDILSPADRLKRAGVIIGISLAVAIVAIPIPLVHLVLVPAALVLGIIFSLVKLGQQEIFRTVRGRCPRCAAEQSFTVMGRFKLPKRLYCRSCQQELTLEGPATQPTAPSSPTT
ncbi:MAG: hypothetical protein QOH59_1723 [Gemmatimonadales bacterium]|nr:hypothetical protein [Gemmatimonadales bacterium]